MLVLFGLFGDIARSELISPVSRVWTCSDELFIYSPAYRAHCCSKQKMAGCSSTQVESQAARSRRILSEASGSSLAHGFLVGSTSRLSPAKYELELSELTPVVFFLSVTGGVELNWQELDSGVDIWEQETRGGTGRPRCFVPWEEDGRGRHRRCHCPWDAHLLTYL